jgi:hypothetical protein
MRFMAAIHGIDIDKAKKEKEEADSFLFRDPKEYKHLSKEEKEKLTQEMLGRHKGWVDRESSLKG